jgi:chromosomal replication initiation ATPase DnaA
VEVVIRLQPPANESIKVLTSQTLQCLNKQYHFDYIFPPETTQEHIYSRVGLKLLAAARKGYNSCVFVYGQTGSGKTYTMTGTPSEQGLVQWCLKSLLNLLAGFDTF